MALHPQGSLAIQAPAPPTVGSRGLGRGASVALGGPGGLQQVGHLPRGLSGARAPEKG